MRKSEIVNDLTGAQLTIVLVTIVIILAVVYFMSCGDGCALP